MRSVEFAKVAAAAEALRLRRLARRQTIRLVLTIIAILFGLAAFALLHLAGYAALSLAVASWLAALFIVVIDLVIAGLLGMLAMNSRPDRIEREALDLRRQSLAEAKRAMTAVAVLGEAASFAVGSGARRALRGPKLGRFMLLADMASRLAPFFSRRR